MYAAPALGSLNSLANDPAADARAYELRRLPSAYGATTFNLGKARRPATRRLSSGHRKSALSAAGLGAALVKSELCSWQSLTPLGLCWRVALGALAVAAASTAHAAYTVQRVVGGLNQPIHMAQAPGDNTSLYIVERADTPTQLGRVRKFDLQTQGVSTFLDLNGTIVSDGGLLSMTFHPEYQSNGIFYIISNNNGVNSLDEYRTISGVPTFQRKILQYQNLNNVFHTMNQAHFRPGGNNYELFVTAGDGGTQANDPGYNKTLIESPTSPFGKLLRIDLTQPFTTPASAPGPGTGISVVARGLRNPYRSGFDRQTGDFYIGDVGFNTAEELDFIPASHFANPAAPILDFGWTDREGTVATVAPFAGGPGSPGDINPIFDYAHSGNPLPHQSVLRGGSITAGYVYRGPVAEFQGRFFFADFTNSNVYSGRFNTSTPVGSYNGTNLTDVTNHSASFEALIGGGADIRNVTSFAEDNSGNLYIVKFGNGFFPPLGQGEIFKISPVLSGAITAQIDRTSGAITLTNTTGAAIAFTSYTIASNFGAISPGDLTPITGHYDSTGDGTVDANNPWQITSSAGSHTLFREATTGDAGTIGASAQVTLSSGDGWIRSYIEDVFVSLLMSDGTVLNSTVTYSGNGGRPFHRGDLNFDGDVDVDDWTALLGGVYTKLAEMSPAESYAFGDLDGDADSDFADFRLFKSDFDAANGAGAFDSMVARLPEPASAALALAAALVCMTSRQRSSKARYAVPTTISTNSTRTCQLTSREGD
jgi:hypothetical protein